MFEKELKRIVLIVLTGVGIALISMDIRSSRDYGLLIFVPLYLLGIVYAGRKLFQLTGRIVKVFFSCEFISLLINPLWGTILCILGFLIAAIGIMLFGWLYGLARCTTCLVVSYREDKQVISN